MRPIGQLEIKGRRPKVILFGNGILRAAKEMSSDNGGQEALDDFMRRILKESIIKSNNDNNQSQSDEEIEEKVLEVMSWPFWSIPSYIAYKNKEPLSCFRMNVSRNFSEDHSNDWLNEMLNRMIKGSNTDIVLTTNYSFEIEKAIHDFDIKTWNNSVGYTLDNKSARKNTRQDLYRYYSHRGTDKPSYPLIWHIHGDAAEPDTIILESKRYVDYERELVEYVDYKLGIYQSKFDTFNEKNDGENWKSWVDYFMYSDIYIVGFALRPEETDIWWLIEETNNIIEKFPLAHKIDGEKRKIVMFGADSSKEMQELYASHGVEYCDLSEFLEKDEQGKYKYARVYEEIARMLENGLI